MARRADDSTLGGECAGEGGTTESAVRPDKAAKSDGRKSGCALATAIPQLTEQGARRKTTRSVKLLARGRRTAWCPEARPSRYQPAPSASGYSVAFSMARKQCSTTTLRSTPRPKSAGLSMRASLSVRMVHTIIRPVCLSSSGAHAPSWATMSEGREVFKRLAISRIS